MADAGIHEQPTIGGPVQACRSLSGAATASLRLLHQDNPKCRYIIVRFVTACGGDSGNSISAMHVRDQSGVQNDPVK